ncbi:baculoviral IAP repeat-containing protein 7 isoform X3 [Echinops telfairi]|uniref:Baculoviral IAP repeat-containing protein 7 isoform X3 n=1 Tax=Echinops telfairi TaxID=9371 RepID=A0AC55DMC7_ECHTE|nr:baculoviral IAP repeat-containing protein 7 isoform X3 [Echinops telfairi]
MMPAATLGPPRRLHRASAALPTQRALPDLGPLVHRLLVPALSQLQGVETDREPWEGLWSPGLGWLDTLESCLCGAGVLPMAPEDKGQCGCQAPGLSPLQGHHTPHAGRPQGLSWDSVDGQILGQLCSLTAEEEKEEEEEEAAYLLGAAFPSMGSQELRLASFHHWPLASLVHPTRLAKAGFFHTGPQDKDPPGNAARSAPVQGDLDMAILRSDANRQGYEDSGVGGTWEAGCSGRAMP